MSDQDEERLSIELIVQSWAHETGRHEDSVREDIFDAALEGQFEFAMHPNDPLRRSGPYRSQITTADGDVIDASHLKNGLDAMQKGGSHNSGRLVQAARKFYISRDGFEQWCGERGEPFPEFWGGDGLAASRPKRPRQSSCREHGWTLEKLENWEEMDDKKRRKLQDINDELEDAAREMEPWGRLTEEEITNNSEYTEDRNRFEKAVGRAIRKGLTPHPIVREWLAIQRSFGDWDALRRFRRRLETGVDRPMSKEDSWIAFYAWDAVDKNVKKEELRRILIRKLRDLEKEMRAKQNKAPGSVSANEHTHIPSPEPEPEKWFDLNLDEITKLRLRLKNKSRQNFHQLLKRIGI